MLEVEAGAAGIGRQENAAGRIVTKPFDQCRPPVRRDAAVKTDIANPASLEPTDDDVLRSRPLRKHHRFGLRLHKQVVEQRRQLVGLDAVVGFLVQQVGAVARHTHVLQGAHQPPLILVRQKPGPAPAANDLRHLVGVLLVKIHLPLGHRHQQVLFSPAGQLLQYFGLPPADHDRCQRLADLVEPAIARNAAAFVLDLMLVQQFPGRAQPMLIDELDDRNQLFQLVFQRRSGQHHRIGAVDAFQGSRGDGIPVLHALGFIDDDQLRSPGCDQIEVRLKFFVVGDLAEILGGIVHPPFARPPPMTRGAFLP